MRQYFLELEQQKYFKMIILGNDIKRLIIYDKPKSVANLPALAPVRNLDKRRAPYLPFAEGITDSIEYRRFPIMKTIAEVNPRGLTAPNLL